GIMNGFLAEIERLAKLFTMSMDFDMWYHLAHQIAAQLYVDQAISKTINLRKEAGKEEVYTAYLVAWLGGLKGVTVYRDESKGVQVIYFGGEQKSLSAKPIKRRKKSKEQSRRKMRMMHLKKKIRREDLEADEKARELFEVKEAATGSGEVVVELTENSTCKTCEV
ncbi:MAG TPA: ribonucleoside-diphosphate reductase, adenosylcobalamin-dependent, partial [Pyrodictium sp.]|nr:ribonucleoside-diphosphate reductase, adenosylcobalamin-dependent [Pyrodictium sp.]